MLVMLPIETASIGTDQWVGAEADPISPAASASLTPVFGVLTLFGLVAPAFFLRHLRRLLEAAGSAMP